MSEIISLSKLGIETEQPASIPTKSFEITVNFEQAKSRSGILLEKLDQYSHDHPGEFEAENISNVWRFIDQIRLQEVGRVDRLHWGSYFKDFNDFKLFYELNPQWHGKSMNELKERDRDGYKFYMAYWTYSKEITKNPITQEVELSKVQDRMDELFTRKSVREIDWSSLKTPENCLDYYSLHPELHDRARSEVQLNGGQGLSFFRIYKRVLIERYTNPETKAVDYGKVEASLDELFPRIFKDWSSFKTKEDFINYYNSRPKLHNKTRAQIQMMDGEGQGFFRAYQKFLTNDNSNPETKIIDQDKVEARLEELFPRLHKNWTDFKTPEDFINYYNFHSELQNKTRAQIWLDHQGGIAFVVAYSNFLKKYCRNPQTKRIDYSQVENKLNELFPRSRKDWEDCKTPEDCLNYYNSHPELHQKTRDQITDLKPGGQIFFKVYRRSLIKRFTDYETKVTDYKKVNEKLDELFPRSKIDWSDLKTEENLINFYNSHPEWKKLGRSEMSKSAYAEIRGFYAKFRRYLEQKYVDSKTGQIDVSKVATRIGEIIPSSPQKKPYKFDNGNIIIFDSRPERIIAILLNKYGLLKDPKERENVHIRINGKKQHSIDFLVNNVFIEFHPVTDHDKKRNILNTSGYLDYKKRSITNNEHLNKPLYHIENIDQLYDVITNPSVNKSFNTLLLSKERFKEDVKEAFKLATKYDLTHVMQKDNLWVKGSSLSP